MQRVGLGYANSTHMQTLQTYIAPWLFGPTKPVPNPQAAVVETCQAVLGGVQQLQQAITSLQVSATF